MSQRCAPELVGHTWRVFRDPHGVPHVQADDLESLAEGHGAVTATDRAWDLEVLRCRAEGRSAALLGAEHLDGDHLCLALGIEEKAKRWWACATAADRAFLAAHARGVNRTLPAAWAGAEAVADLALTGRSPRPWEPWTPVAVHLETHALSGSLPEQLWRDLLTRRLGPDWVKVLDAEAVTSAGSNAWLVPGELTVSGAPMIAADPHRLVEESGPYQPICLSAPGLRVRGLALVGLPGVPHFGRTESAAWAITASMATTHRLRTVVVERRGGRLYQAATNTPVTERKVTLHDDADAPVTRWVRTLGRNPVLPGNTEHEQRLADLAEDRHHTVKVIEPLQDWQPERALAATRELLTTATAQDVVAAFDGWALPVNDVVAADTQGNTQNWVAGQCAGVPGTPRPADGLLVRANQRSTGTADDPGDGVERIGCASPHRAARARAVLLEHVAGHVANGDNHGGARIGHDHLAAAQLDTVLPHWPPLLAELLGTGPVAAELVETGAVATEQAEAQHPETGATSHEDNPDPQTPTRGQAQTERQEQTQQRTQRLRERLLSWDGTMAADSADAAVFAAWRDAFTVNLAASPALAPMREDTGLPQLWAPFLGLVPRVGLALENIILHGPAVGVDPVRAAEQALVAIAQTDLGGAGGQDVVAPYLSGDSAGSPRSGQATTWGVQHSFTPLRAHPGLPPLASVPVGGDTDCLLAAGTLPGTGPGCVRVPAARVIWDLADPAASAWITPDPINRGNLPDAPIHRWAAGQLDQALPWVPPGGLGTEAGQGDAPIELGTTTSQSLPVRLRPVDPSVDAALIHDWVSQPRAQFWGMTDLSTEQVGAIYALIGASPTHHAWIIEVGGTPRGIFQTYEPHADPAGATFRVEPGDLGIHLLLAVPTDTARVHGLTADLSRMLIRRAKASGTRRIVVEPDVANALAINRMESVGFQLGPQVQLPTKTGRLAFLPLLSG